MENEQLAYSQEPENGRNQVQLLETAPKPLI